MNLNTEGLMGSQMLTAGRRSVNLVAVFSMVPDEYSELLTQKALPESAGRAVLRDWCDRADLVLMAFCEEKDGVLGAIRARVGNPLPNPPAYDLTPHELRMLRLMVEGHSYKTAATKLGVSVNTVAFHIQNIYGKLQVHSKSEAVARALNEGLLEARAS
jgi:DNA-binding CsgD family transcriptional regulator